MIFIEEEKWAVADISVNLDGGFDDSITKNHPLLTHDYYTKCWFAISMTEIVLRLINSPEAINGMNDIEWDII